MLKERELVEWQQIPLPLDTIIEILGRIQSPTDKLPSAVDTSGTKQSASIFPAFFRGEIFSL